MDLKTVNINIKTVEEKEELESYLELLEESVFKKEGFAQTLKDSVPVKYSSFIKEFLDKNKVSINDGESVKSAFDGLKSYLKNLTPVNLTIAYSPSEKSLENIYNWVFKNIGENIILDIDIDSGLLGGAIISYKGKYSDYSLKKSLEEGFRNHDKEIRELIDSNSDRRSQNANL